MAEVEARRARGERVLDLTETNPTRVGFRYETDAILAAWARPEALLYEPSPRGLPAARAAVAAYYRDHGREVDPDTVFLTASTSEAYAFVFKLLADPGDEILVPQPSYPLFEHLTALEGLVPVPYRLAFTSTGGWSLDRASVRAAMGPRTRAIVAVSPNNPTGSYLAPDELAFLSETCAAHGAGLIVDEVFLDYPRKGGVHSPASSAGNQEALTFTLSGLSKVVALPQVKLGWIVVSGPEVLAAEACERLDLVTDTYLSVGTAVQHAAPELLARRAAIQDQVRERVETNARALEAACAGTPLTVLPCDAGWYALVRLSRGESDDVFAERLLREAGVLVHPGYFYDFDEEDLIVLSLIGESPAFAEGVGALHALVGRS
jgi:aspartate/methionine/tyrosine aminotransferase